MEFIDPYLPVILLLAYAITIEVYSKAISNKKTRWVIRLIWTLLILMYLIPLLSDIKIVIPK